MDNASKALIMAGAILIAVGIVGIGIYIFTTANSMTDDALNQIDALTVQSVNSQLVQYEGKIRGRELKACINAARSINNQNALPNSKTIGLKFGSIDVNKVPNSTVTGISDNTDYNVSFEYDDATGFISKIVVD